VTELEEDDITGAPEDDEDEVVDDEDEPAEEEELPADDE
jgi:hypothetical protein